MGPQEQPELGVASVEEPARAAADCQPGTASRSTMTPNRSRGKSAVRHRTRWRKGNLPTARFDAIAPWRVRAATGIVPAPQGA